MGKIKSLLGYSIATIEAAGSPRVFTQYFVSNRIAVLHEEVILGGSISEWRHETQKDAEGYLQVLSYVCRGVAGRRLAWPEKHSCSKPYSDYQKSSALRFLSGRRIVSERRVLTFFRKTGSLLLICDV